MSASGWLLSQQRLVLSIAFVLAVMGVFASLTMPRQEDPTFPTRNALLLVPYPGADALTVERLIIDPIEERLAEVPEIVELSSTARADVAIVNIELSDSVYAPEPIFDDIREKLDEAAGDFPDGALPWSLDTEVTQQESMVVVLTGPSDPIALLRASEALKARLLDLSTVQKVTVIADPGEQITVQLDSEVSRRVGLPPGVLAQRIAAQTAAVPGGSLQQGGTSVVVDPRNALASLTELVDLPISLGDGRSVPLGALAEVAYGPSAPVGERMRLDGARAVALGVVPRPGIDVVRFGDAVRAVVAEGAPGATAVLLTDQPRRVEARLSDLRASLLQGVAIVAGVLMLTMGLRLGGVVAMIVPLVTFISVALYAAAGGVLQQISIAGLVLSLGLLVDNGIVIAERVQYRIDRGQSAPDAARATVAELAIPLLSATGTTVASFVPLLLSQGGPADFTRAIPQMVILTLTVSFVAALTVTPTVAALFFRPSRSAGATEVPGWIARLSRLPARQPRRIALGVAALVAGALALAPLVRQQFFPGSDRDQLVLELSFPEGTHLTETDAASAALEAALSARPEVEHVAAFIGRSTPRFYYNLSRKPQAPHLAQLLLDLRSAEDIAPVTRWARSYAAENLTGVTFVARPLEQGPPLQAPIELRLLGDDLTALWETANLLHARLRETPGTADVRHDLSAGVPAVSVQPVDAALTRYGLTRRELAQALLGQTRGLPAGWYRAGADPVPIVVRSPDGEQTALSRLQTVDVWSPTAGPVPLMALAEVGLELRPAALTHRNGERLVTVSAQLDGVTFDAVLGAVLPELEALVAARGLRLELGGEREGSGEANSAIFVAAPLGGAMLLGFLLAQFRSFRKVGIVLLTVPLAACGVVPGLLLADQPFGFTSLLGVFALIGIVVNNAIILIDFIDTARDEGATVEDAAAQAVQVRIRPILLTTATTIAGLLPLLFSASTLWPPLASALISGLAASTALTLLVVPAAYILLFTPGALRLRPAPSAAAAAVAVLLLPSLSQAATLEEALQAAEASSRSLALAQQSAAEADAAILQARSAFLPRVAAQGSYTRSQEEIRFDPGAALEDIDFLRASDLEPIFAAFEDPAQVAAVFEAVRAEEAARGEVTIDPIVVRQLQYFDASASVIQPLLDAPALPRLRAAQAAAEGARLSAEDARLQLRAGTTRAYYAVAIADEAVALAEQRITNAQDHLALAQRQLEAGAAPRIVAVQAELELTEAHRQRAEARASQVAARQVLHRLTGLSVAEPVQLPERPAVPAEAVRQPAQQAAALRVDAAQRALRADRLAWTPTVQLQLTTTWTQNLGFQDNPTYSFLAVNAAWTLFDGGYRRGARHQSLARLQAARLLSEEADALAAEQQATAAARLTQADIALEARDRELDLAEEAQRLAEEAYRAGQGAWLPVRDARLRADAARLGVLLGRMDRDLAAVDLAVARGQY